MSAFAALELGSERILDALLRTSIQGALFIAAVWLACRLVPRLPASVRCGLWWAACLKLLVGLVWISPIELPLLPAVEARFESIKDVEDVKDRKDGNEAAAGVHALRVGAGLDGGLGARPALGASDRPGTALIKPISFAILILGWLTGLLALSLKARRQLRHTRWVIRRSQPLREGWVHAVFAELCERLALRRLPGLRGSDDVRTPQAIGLLRPLVLLPRTGLDRLSPAEASMTLCHELVHLRRGDLWLGWVPALAHRIFFFHPLAALAAREYAIAREAACDAEVLRLLGTAPQAYGRLLLRWGVAPRETGLAAAGASPSLQNLKRRLQMLQQTSELTPEKKRRLSGWWWLAGAAVLVGLIPLHIVAQEPAPEALPEPAPEAAEAPVVAETPIAEPAVAPAAEAVVVEGVAGGVEDGVVGGVAGGVEGGVAGGVDGGVAGGVEGGVTGGIGAAVAPRAPRPAPAPVAGAPSAAPPAMAMIPPVRPAVAPAPMPPTGRGPVGVPPTPHALAGMPSPALAPAAMPRPGALPVARPALAAPRALPASAATPRGYAAPAVPPAPPAPAAPAKHGYSWSYHSNGDSWILLYGNDSSTMMSGTTGDLEKLKRLRGDSKEAILWFRHDGKEYVVRDAAVLKQAKEIFRPQMELGAKQGELGARQGALGAKQGALGGKQGELGGQQGTLGAQLASLAAERMARDDDSPDFEKRERDLEAKMDELGRKQEELGRQQEALGRQQEELGRQQEELGRQQEAASEKAEREFRALRDRAIQSGVAQEMK